MYAVNSPKMVRKVSIAIVYVLTLYIVNRNFISLASKVFYSVFSDREMTILSMNLYIFILFNLFRKLDLFNLSQYKFCVKPEAL